MTRPRRAVLDCLKRNHQPSSAQEIYKKVSGIDLVSIYRTLALFEELGLIQREDLAGTARYYLAEHPHHHIICRKCGRTKCVPCRNAFSRIKGYKDVTHQLIFEGVCNRCGL